MNFLKENGIYITRKQLSDHVYAHSRHVVEAIKATKKTILDAQEKALANVETITGEVLLDAEDVIQDIINIGGEKVRTGDMRVTEKLLLGALKEQRDRKTQGSMRELLEGLQRKRFEIPVIEEVHDEKPATDIQ